MPSKKKARRVAVNADKLDTDLDSDELRQLLQIPEAIWGDMPDSQKLLMLAQMGLETAKSTLDEAKEK